MIIRFVLEHVYFRGDIDLREERTFGIPVVVGALVASKEPYLIRYIMQLHERRGQILWLQTQSHCLWPLIEIWCLQLQPRFYS